MRWNTHDSILLLAHFSSRKRFDCSSMFFSSIAEVLCELMLIDLVIELAAKKHGHSTSDDKQRLAKASFLCIHVSFPRSFHPGRLPFLSLTQ